MTRPPITLAQQIEAIDGIIAECEADSYLASLELVDALRAAAATLRELKEWEDETEADRLERIFNKNNMRHD